MQENISINKKLRSGIDLIEIKRLEKSYEKFGMRMLTRLYDESEIDIFSKRKGYNGARYLAKNFAGKEAVSKLGQNRIDELNYLPNDFNYTP